MLIGNSIRLRLASIDDAQLVAEWYGDPEYLGEFSNTWPRSRQEWERLLGMEKERNDGAFYIIVPSDSEEPLGTAGYWYPFTAKMFQGLELSYEVHPSSRQKGIATQVACLLVNHLFNSLPVERLQATAVVGNHASHRVLEKAGMQKEGSYRRVTFVHGEYMDMDVYSIVRNDWIDEHAYRQGRGAF